MNKEFRLRSASQLRDLSFIILVLLAVSLMAAVCSAQETDTALESPNGSNPPLLGASSLESPEMDRLRGVQLFQVKNTLKHRFFADLQRECLRIRESLKSKKSKTGTELRFLEAVDELGELAGELKKTKRLLDGLPTIEALSDSRRDVEQVLDAFARLRTLPILGSDVVAMLNTLLKQHVKLRDDLQRMADLTRPLQEVEMVWGELQQSVTAGEMTDVTELNTQFDRIAESLDQTKSKLDNVAEKAVASAVLTEVKRLQREIGQNRELLVFRVELILSSADISKARATKNEPDALRMVEVLKTRHESLSRYNKLTQGIKGEDRVELQKTLLDLRTAIDQCRKHALQLALQAARSTLEEIRKTQGRLLDNFQPKDLPINELNGLKTSLGTLVARFRKRCEEMEEPSPEAQKILDELTTAMTGLDQGIWLLTVQRDYSSRLPEAASIKEIGSAETRLGATQEELSRLVPNLLPELKALHKKADALLHNREAELEALRTQREADQAADNINLIFQKTETSLTAGQTAAASQSLFDASVAVEAFRTRVSSHPLLSRDTQRGAQVQQFGEKVGELSHTVDQQRRDERRQAGWIELPDEKSTQLPATAESRWLNVEMLIALGDFEGAERALADLRQTFRDSSWPDWVAAREAQLNLLKARHLEAEGETAAALAAFAEVSRESGPAGIAAAAALQNLEQQVRRRADAAGFYFRCLAAAGFVAILSAVLALSMRKYTISGRLKQTKSLLGRFRHIEERSRRAASAHLRERIAFFLASLPDSHPEKQRIQAELSRAGHFEPIVLAPVSTARHEPVPAIDEPALAGVVADVIGTQPATEDAPKLVVDWLGTGESRRRKSRKLRAKALAWLKEHVEPHKSDLPDVLRWKVRLATACRGEADRKQWWPLQYELEGLTILGEWEAALEAAQRIPVKGAHRTLAELVVVTIGRCYVELGQWQDATEWLGGFAKKKSALASKEVRYWFNIATARETVESGKRLRTTDLDHLLEAIVGGGQKT